MKSQSLDSLLIIAAENNPSLKAKYLEFEAALEKVAQTNTLPDPNLSMGYFISPVETRVGPQRFKIGLSQMFPWFGTLKTAENAQQLIAESKYQDFLDAKYELLMKVKTAWYPLYEIEGKIKYQQENLEILKSYKNLATTKYENNQGAMVDIIRVDISIENIQTDITILEDQVRPITVHFNTLLNRPDSIALLIPDSLEIPKKYEYFSNTETLASNPKLESFDLRVNALDESKELVRKNGLPKLGLGLDYVFIDERTDVALPNNGQNVIMPMANISLPIYRKKYNSAIRELELKKESLSLQKMAFENSLLSNLEQAQFELNKSRKLSKHFQNQSTKTSQALNLLLSAYSNDGKEFEEILKLQQELVKYKIANLSATKSYYIALAKIDYLSTKPINDEK
jgi:outer membrane protein TolC